MGFVAPIFGIITGICIGVIILSAIVVFAYYQKRQLVKANFWINVAIFALAVIMCLIYIIDCCLE